MAICILVACMAQGIPLSQTPNGATALVVPIVLNAIAWPCFLYWQHISSPGICMKFEKEFNEWFRKNGEKEVNELKESYNKFERREDPDDEQQKKRFEKIQ